MALGLPDSPKTVQLHFRLVELITPRTRGSETLWAPQLALCLETAGRSKKKPGYKNTMFSRVMIGFPDMGYYNPQ